MHEGQNPQTKQPPQAFRSARVNRCGRERVVSTARPRRLVLQIATNSLRHGLIHAWPYTRQQKSAQCWNHICACSVCLHHRTRPQRSSKGDTTRTARSRILRRTSCYRWPQPSSHIQRSSVEPNTQRAKLLHCNFSIAAGAACKCKLNAYKLSSSQQFSKHVSIPGDVPRLRQSRQIAYF